MSKVLVVAVHGDDETLGCGGTLLKHKAQGDDIHWLLITGPTKMHPLNFPKEVVDKRNDTIEKVEKMYEFDSRFSLDFPTVFVHAVDFGELVSRVSSVINELKPNIIYMMSNNDVHSDHRVTFDAVYSCTKSFRYPFIDRVYMMETLSETEFAPAITSKTFVPNVFVDITDYIDKKLEIMSMYDTEVMDEPYPRSLSSIKALARVRGSRAGVMYAEAFQLLYEKR